jgi:hypothetical protein
MLFRLTPGERRALAVVLLLLTVGTLALAILP